MNFAMSDIYGGIWGTTELTIPEPNDQKALVDDQKTADTVSNTGKKKIPVGLALVVILIIAVLAGVLK